MIRISIVVPFYNSERYLSECIEGLLSQRYPENQYEIVMVDNNSMDASADIVRRHSRVKLIAQERQGSYAARNRGLVEAHGEIIAFTDADCVPSSDWLPELETAMASSGAAIIIGRNQFARASYFLRMLEDYENEKNTYIFGGQRKEIYYGYSNNMAVRKTLFADLGPFTELARGADVVFVRRCVDRYSCESVRYAPRAQVRHMELDSPGQYFRKVFTYGGSIHKYRGLVDARPLDNWERLLVFRRTIRDQRYSSTRAVLLFTLLSVGLICWNAGSIGVTWNPKLWSSSRPPAATP